MTQSTALVNVSSMYSRILSTLPTKHVKFSFAYGSGAVKQINSEMSTNMIDFIIAVDNPAEWHKQNIQMNPDHYSILSSFGHNFVANIQTNFKARTYFNTMVPLEKENVMIKYGIISQEDLINDLLDWCDLYIAGRLHKPIQVIQTPADSTLKSAIQLNRQSAVHAALLLLPEHFTEMEFYRKIASLSYEGDFRMIIGEDKNKVNNIVGEQLPKFRELYAPVLRSLSDHLDFQPDVELGIKDCSGSMLCRQDISPLSKHYHLNHLPRTPLRKLVSHWNFSTKKRQDVEDVLHCMAYDPDCSKFLYKVLTDIVFQSSAAQSIKGVFTAGVVKSVKYSTRKLCKMLKSQTV